MKKTLLLAGVASVFAFSAQAIEFTPYVGADYNVNFTNKASFLDGKIPGKYHSGSIVAGTKVSPYAAVEAFGELSRHAWKKSVHSEYGAYGVDAFGILPLGCYGEWEVLGTAGIGRYRFERKDKNFSGSKTFHVWGYRLGAGVQYNITENWGVRAMYRHVAFVNKVVRGFDTLSFGVRYAF
ncbi:MAG: porin family protein [Alphaproteobacteria bacterium]|nr:porin family protein [Alphaproteobacteria bacterium]